MSAKQKTRRTPVLWRGKVKVVTYLEPADWHLLTEMAELEGRTLTGQARFALRQYVNGGK